MGVEINFKAKGEKFKGLTNTYHFQNSHFSTSSRIDVDWCQLIIAISRMLEEPMANATALPSFEEQFQESSMDDMNSLENA